MDKADPDQLKTLLSACLEGKTDARKNFQDLFGETIYAYPIKSFRLPRDKAADFYIYVFERERVFRRLSTFEGRNKAQFETYLCFYVLRDLFFEWQRQEKQLETVSWDSMVPGGNSSSKGAPLNDGNADSVYADEPTASEQENAGAESVLLQNLDLEKRVVLKLLCLAEFDLAAEEIRFIAQKSKRSYRDIVILVEQARTSLMRKDEQTTALQDQLDSIFGWILLYQKELAKLNSDLRSAAEGTPEHTQVRRQQEEWERKLEWRYRQQQQVRERVAQLRLTMPYKEIARLLNMPIGTVCSLIARARAEILGTLGDRLSAIGAVA